MPVYYMEDTSSSISKGNFIKWYRGVSLQNQKSSQKEYRSEFQNLEFKCTYMFLYLHSVLYLVTNPFVKRII